MFRNFRFAMMAAMLLAVLTGCDSLLRLSMDEVVSTPAAAIPQAVARVDSNVRSGDSTAYAIVGGLYAGQTAPILGVSSSGSGWLYIQTPGGALGFVSPTLVSVSGDLNALPRIAPQTLPPTQAPAAPASQPMVNLAVSGLQLVGGGANCSDRTSIVFTITNTGAVTAPESTMKLVMFTMPRLSTVVEVTGVVPAIPAGGSVQTGADLFLNAAPDGSYVLRATADITESIPEYNVNDNFMDIGVTLNCGVSSVNLRVTALGLSTGAVNCADRTSIFFSVTNDGPTAAGATTAALEVIAPSPTNITVSIPPLNPGETFNSGADLFLNTLLAGTYQLRATADAGFSVSESNEGDNVSETAFTVACG